MQNINGSYTGIMGLPLFETAQLLRAVELCCAIERRGHIDSVWLASRAVSGYGCRVCRGESGLLPGHCSTREKILGVIDSPEQWWPLLTGSDVERRGLVAPAGLQVTWYVPSSGSECRR